MNPLPVGVNHVGINYQRFMIAINDSFLLESFVFLVIKKHFAGEPDVYMHLMELFREVNLQTQIGQLLDLTSQPMDGKIDLGRFTPLRHKMIVKYKTAFYSFYLPIACGLIISGINDEKSLELAKNICMIMGEYFQVQDDYLDCYGDPQVIGKIGTDIQDNKCGWLVVQALEKATPEQRVILEENYGKNDMKCVEIIKKLYREMDLEGLYIDYETKSYNAIQ